MIPARYRSGLTAKTVGITCLIAVLVIGATLWTSRAFQRLDALVVNMTNTEMDNLMTSVRLVQQTESLISLGLMLTAAETQHERRAALIDLTDRTAWIGQLTKEFYHSGADTELIARIEHTQQRLSDNITLLNSLVRDRIDGQASDSELAHIRTLATENRELAGRLSALMGYVAATMRTQMLDQSRQLSAEIQTHQQRLTWLTLLLLVTALVSGIYFEMTVVRRILRFQRALGEPDVTPDHLRVGGSDEISQLGATMGRYVERIQSQEARMQKIHTELAFLAEHDPLTELANRRHFHVAARALLEQTTQPLCVAIGDIDHFKQINDRYGHAIGDQTLVHVARRISAGLRDTDILARFGGEEFAAVLSVRSSEDGYRIFEQIRQDIARHPLTLDDGEQIGVTISFGLTMITDLDARSTLPASALPALLNDALRQADSALYRAKRAGRNRVDMTTAPPSADTTGTAPV
jgi:diguanylate cyclase (GGDEF)-like protein